MEPKRNHCVSYFVHCDKKQPSWVSCNQFKLTLSTLMPLYHCHKPVFRPKMAIFQRAGMREGGLPLPLARMTVFELFYEMKLKTSKFKVLPI